MSDYNPTVSEEVRRGLDDPLTPAGGQTVRQLVPTGEGDLQYSPETGTVFAPDPARKGIFQEDPRKFTFNLPTVTTPEGTVQRANVFNAPTLTTARRIAARFGAVLPSAACSIEAESNFDVYRYSHTPYAVVVSTKGRVPLRAMAGRHAHFLMRFGWERWKSEVRELVELVSPGLPLDMDVLEPLDW